ATEALLEGLQAVVSGEATADAGSDLAERQVDLVVQNEHTVERKLERAAGRTDRPAGLVHVGLGQQHRDPRAAGTRASLGQQSPVLGLRLRQTPAIREHV